MVLLTDPVFTDGDGRVATAEPRMPVTAPKGFEEVAALRQLVHLAAVGDGQSEGQHVVPRLPYTRREAEQILAVLPSRANLEAVDFKASIATATSPELGRYRYVHFATHGYIDTEHEARKLLVEQMQGTLQAIAKDVKIQVEFNPAEVGSYRLIGYENRILAKEDFNDDTKDAGDIGAGHEVTALYEVVPVEVQAKTNEARLAQLRDMEKKYLELQAVAGQTADGRPPHEAELAAVRAEIEALTKGQPAPPVDDLKYQEKPAVAPAAASGELLTVKLRYKGPEEAKEQGTSALVEFPVKDEPRPFAEMDQDFQLAASAAGFGMLLRDSPYRGTLTWAGLDEMTRGIELLKLLQDPQPQAPVDPRVEELKRLFPDLMAEQRGEAERRTEFRELVKMAAALSGRP